MEVSRILVPLDGSVLAESALPKAVELARIYGGSLMLLRAAEAHVFPGGDPVASQVDVVREAEQYLEQVKDRLRSTGVADITTSVWYGEPAPSIVEAAEFNRIGMIVMTTHGRSGFGRVLLGSVAESVLRGTSTPILVLHPDGAPLLAAPGIGSPGAAREATVSARTS
jgi:nucleotide-binding universal stress UspA family protein